MTMKIERDDAAMLFIKTLIRRRDIVIRGEYSILEKGPPGRRPHQDDISLHKWFQSLDEESRVYVRAILQRGVDAALFGVLAILDRVTQTNPVEGELSDFALYLQIYEDEIALNNDSPKISVRLNPSNAIEDLHDIYLEMLGKNV